MDSHVRFSTSRSCWVRTWFGSTFWPAAKRCTKLLSLFSPVPRRRERTRSRVLSVCSPSGEIGFFIREKKKLFHSADTRSEERRLLIKLQVEANSDLSSGDLVEQQTPSQRSFAVLILLYGCHGNLRATQEVWKHAGKRVSVSISKRRDSAEEMSCTCRRERTDPARTRWCTGRPGTGLWWRTDSWSSI